MKIVTILVKRMDRYANMRGSFFTKHLKTNGTGNLVKKMANSQSTRARVASTVVSSKAAGEAVKDAKIKALWREAEDRVFEFSDEDDSTYNSNM